MHPITSYYTAQAHLDELRREAEQFRSVGVSRRAVSRTAGFRAAAGSLLIHTGERILPRPSIQTTGPQC
jgi:hypothetical protein